MSRQEIEFVEACVQAAYPMPRGMTTVSSAREMTLTLEDVRRAYHWLRQTTRTPSRLKAYAAISPHGLCISEQRMYLCMGVVKSDDAVITWDSDAMAKGEAWCLRSAKSKVR